jgi:ubiquinone/menaquinone biosynthesis C-methylase UbiE
MTNRRLVLTEKVKHNIVPSSNIWDRLWGNYKSGYSTLSCDQIVRQKILSSWIKSIEGKKIIEVGAGTGLDSIYFAKKGASVTCLDNSTEALDLCKKNFDMNNVHATFTQADVQNLPLDTASYDVVYSAGLLEHFKDPRSVINEMVRITKKGGFIICFVPQTLSWWTIKKIPLIKNNTWFGGWETNYSYFSLRRIFKRRDTCIVGVRGLHILVTPVDYYAKYYFNKKKGWLLRCLDSTFISTLFGLEIGICVKKV